MCRALKIIILAAKKEWRGSGGVQIKVRGPFRVQRQDAARAIPNGQWRQDVWMCGGRRLFLHSSKDGGALLPQPFSGRAPPFPFFLNPAEYAVLATGLIPNNRDVAVWNVNTKKTSESEKLPH